MELEKYIISIEKNGHMVPVGSISGEDYRTARFSYRDEYVDDADAVPISISLPLQREFFGRADQTASYIMITRQLPSFGQRALWREEKS